MSPQVTCVVSRCGCLSCSTVLHHPTEILFDRFGIARCDQGHLSSDILIQSRGRLSIRVMSRRRAATRSTPRPLTSAAARTPASRSSAPAPAARTPTPALHPPPPTPRHPAPTPYASKSAARALSAAELFAPARCGGGPAARVEAGRAGGRAGHTARRAGPRTPVARLLPAVRAAAHGIRGGVGGPKRRKTEVGEEDWVEGGGRLGAE